MPSALRSPKTLSRWFELDYHKRRRLFRGLWWGTAVAGAALAVVTLLAMTGAIGHRSFQAGPVAPPHAMFNHDCRACHDGGFRTLARLFGGAGVSVPNHKCTACHNGSHHNEPHAPIGRCVDCHKEHRGHAALIRVDDRHCARCHAELKRAGGTPTPFHTSVTAFTEKGHPPFRTPADTGTVRFPHEAHLADAGVLEPHAGGRRTVKLGCADCHEPGDRGRYMRPISYDRHCARCHPISVAVPGDFKEDKDPQRRKLALDFAARPLPHPRRGQTAEVVRAALRDRLAAFITAPTGRLFLEGREAVPPRPLTDRHPLELGAPLSEKAFAWVNEKLAEGERVVFEGAGGCSYCHAAKGARLPRTEGGLPAVPAAAIPERWFTHGLFDHKAHRMLDCASCHAAKGSKEAKDVLLPGVDNCLKCHTKGATASPRADCVECHLYHDPAKQRQAPAGTRRLADIRP